MESKKPVFTRIEGFPTPPGAEKSRLRVLATKDHGVIQGWAERHKAEPATGEATASGPATVQVTDGGAGIRFNFPGAGRFRPITWTEWFDNFDRHQLTFLFEEEVPDRAYEYWQERGGGHGHDREDWLRAERELGPGTGTGRGARYRLINETEHSR